MSARWLCSQICTRHVLRKAAGQRTASVTHRPRRPQACTLSSAKLQEGALQQAGLICDGARATARVHCPRGTARNGQSPASERHGLQKRGHLVVQRILHATCAWRTCRRADGQTGACCTLVRIRVSVGWAAAGPLQSQPHSRKVGHQQDCKNRLDTQEHAGPSRRRLQSMDNRPQTVKAAACRAEQARRLQHQGLARMSALRSQGCSLHPRMRCL